MYRVDESVRTNESGLRDASRAGVGRGVRSGAQTPRSGKGDTEARTLGSLLLLRQWSRFSTSRGERVNAPFDSDALEVAGLLPVRLVSASRRVDKGPRVGVTIGERLALREGVEDVIEWGT